MGIAYVFNLHGLSYEDYTAYMNQSLEWGGPIPVSTVEDINYSYNPESGEEIIGEE